MDYHYIDENLAGEYVIYDRHQQEVARFAGPSGLEAALQWANAQGLVLRSNVPPSTLMNQSHYNRLHALLFGRRRRKRRMSTPTITEAQPNDPDNVQRIIVQDDDFNFDDFDWHETDAEDIDDWLYPDDFSDV